MKKDSKDIWSGFNTVTKQIENLKEAGIVDPLKVTKSAFTNAVSVASNFLTVGAAISELPKKEHPPAAGMPHEEY